MNVARVPLGVEIPLLVQVRNSSGVPALPTSAPTVDIVNSSGVTVYSTYLAPVGRASATGLFGGSFFLDGRFAVGYYAILYRWTVSATAGADCETFQVIAGGDAAGEVTSLFWVDRPWAQTVLQGLSSGRLRKRTNPRL